MKKILVSLLIASTVTLSGCQAMKENPALGIGIGVAAGAVAASVAANHHDKHKDDDRKDNDRWDRDEHRDRTHNQHGRRNLPTCDFSYGNPDHKCVQGDGTIYRP